MEEPQWNHASESEDPPPAPEPALGANEPAQVKRLYRSSDKKLLLGVCGGLGEYFDIDPNIIRIIFAVLSIFGGGGILLYVALVFIMPSEDKLEQHPRDAARATVEEAVQETRQAVGKASEWVRANNPMSSRKDNTDNTP